MGSARAYVGNQSAVSSSGTDGRLMFASNSSQFFHVGSGGTALLGGGRVLSVGTTTGIGYPQRAQWIEEFGLFHLAAASSASTTVTIPNSGYSGVPFVFLTQNQLSDGFTDTTGIASVAATAITATSFTCWTVGGAGGSGYTIAWRSIGTRTL